MSAVPFLYIFTQNINREEPVDEEADEAKEYDTDEEFEEVEEDNTLKELELIGGGKNIRYVNFDDGSNKVTFSDVGGLDNLKKAIELKIIKPFRTPGIFAKFKKKVGGGILLYGPPGCGKTFIAKATAGECDATFLPVDIADILSPYADIENVVETAVENVISEILEGGEERKVTTKDLTDVIEEVRPTIIEWLRTVVNYVKYANQGGFFNDVEDFIRTHKKYI